MTLVSEVKYETSIGELKDISPESVLSMLRGVRVDIGRLDVNFADFDLAGVLEAVEAGKYEVHGTVLTRIDLSAAKSVIDTYRKYSKGGCQSCLDVRRDVINDDRDTFYYCHVKEHHERTPKECGYGVGSSPEVRKHRDTPCDSWKPRFSPKLEELIAKKIE